ncbi:hypothetical protein [Streptomyces sp. NPDC005017]|uniref:hypothetical protein n=1 Tax=Streptomyces sp. NPDC005017 TaxID=3364706 RepID=UPI0036B600BB
MTIENDLTDAQKGVYAENASALDKAEEQLRMAQQEARARLKEVGIDNEGVTECMKCGCPAYVPTPHHPGAFCPREFCGHSWASHIW